MGEPDQDEQACGCPAESQIGRYYDTRVAERIAKGQENAVLPVSQHLLTALTALGPGGRTVLEVGCGRGGLLLGLAQAGSAKSTGVDLSSASIGVAQKRFDEAGFSERVNFAVGDGATLPLEPHDWVILDRVICCYRDFDKLMANTVPMAGRIYAFSVPISRGWRGLFARVGIGLENVWDRWHGQIAPGYVHDLDQIERRLSDAGFRLLREEHLRIWQVAVWERMAT